MIRTDTHTIGLFFNFNYFLESFYQWVKPVKYPQSLK